MELDGSQAFLYIPGQASAGIAPPETHRVLPRADGGPLVLRLESTFGIGPSELLMKVFKCPLDCAPLHPPLCHLWGSTWKMLQSLVTEHAAPRG